MGNCRSCDSTSMVTAKLILVGGQLQEFSRPVKVSLLPQKDSDCFICSSEEMEFDEFAAAMDGDEVLEPGEIYFELPLAWRNVRLQVEDMAALAFKASLALARKSRDGDDDDDDNLISFSCFCCCRPKRAAPAALFREKEMPLLDGDAKRGLWKGGAGGAKRRKFVAKLTAIVED